LSLVVVIGLIADFMLGAWRVDAATSLAIIWLLVKEGRETWNDQDCTVGNLMGFLVGKSFFIEGYFARLMYRSLYKMHEVALHGLAKVILGTIGRTFRRRNAPVVKLH